jgi:3-oxoacyl-[acyl-carrier-protein] synthase II
MNRVVVTGIGVLSPLGNDYSAFVKGLKNGNSGAAPITYFDARNFKTKFACELKNFKAEDRLDRKEIRRLDAFAQYALCSTEEAMEHSRLDLNKIDLKRAGVIWGSGIGGLKSLQDDIESNAGKETMRFSPFMIPKMIPDIAPGHISIKYGFRGINYCTVSACASSTHALINAVDYIKLGKADIIIAGGSEAAITKTGIGGFSSMKALSQRNDDPASASRPFDKDRDGFVLGEGSATLILESLDHAQARGANILAEIKGGGMTADAYHMTAPHPQGLGAISAMSTALQDAGLEAHEIDYINVHGTSTPLGDVAELKAIKEVFGEHAYKLNISSTKSMTGHLLGAAGALETVAGIASIQDGFVPPTINFHTPDPDIDSKINLTTNEAQNKPIRAVLSNTFGFGGHNSSVIIKKFDQ